MLTEAQLDAYMKAFGRAVREQRDLLHVPQRLIAERAGISVPYLSDIERGTKNPNLNVIRRLASALELEHVELWRRADQHNEPPAPTTEYGESLADWLVQ